MESIDYIIPVAVGDGSKFSTTFAAARTPPPHPVAEVFVKVDVFAPQPERERLPNLERRVKPEPGKKLP